MFLCVILLSSFCEIGHYNAYVVTEKMHEQINMDDYTNYRPGRGLGGLLLSMNEEEKHSLKQKLIISKLQKKWLSFILVMSLEFKVNEISLPKTMALYLQQTMVYE